MSETKPAACCQHEALVAEYRAETVALRRVMKAVEASKHKSGMMVEFLSEEDGVRWIITASNVATEGMMCDALAEHIAKELRRAIRITSLAFTGSSRHEPRAVIDSNPPASQERQS